MEILVYLFIGAVGGFMGGLLGVGGGLAVVPLLSTYFYSAGFPADITMHLAIGSSLGSMIATTGTASWAHLRHQASPQPALRMMGLSLVVGSVAGALVADALASQTLSLIFGGVTLLLALFLLLDLPSKFRNRGESKKSVTSLYAFGTGVVSTVMGIGAGAFGIPFMLAYLRMSIHNAIAAGAFLSLYVAISGTLLYFFTGLNAKNLPDYSLGYLYLPAVLGVSVGSLYFAWLGAKVAHRMPPAALRGVFGIFLVVVGTKMIATSFG
jgi:uncharacterized membrane protein YfcA